jgi:hypothetical protein
MKSSNEYITARPGDLNGVHSLVPFASVIWTLYDGFGILTGLGANIAPQEKAYIILRNDGSEDFVMMPFYTKLTYQLGVIVQL